MVTLLAGPAIVSSFSDNKNDDDRQHSSRYADIYAAISPICEDFPPNVGITKTSAYSCLCRHRHKHDLRHSFAVRTLLGWYRAGLDVDQRLPLLSTYLGHVQPASTYWYLQAVPELLALAGERLDGVLGERS